MKVNEPYTERTNSSGNLKGTTVSSSSNPPHKFRPYRKPLFLFYLFIFIFTHNQLEIIIVHVEIKIVNKEAATKRSTMLLHAQRQLYMVAVPLNKAM